MQCLTYWMSMLKWSRSLFYADITHESMKKSRAIRDIRLTKSTLMNNSYDKQTQGGEAQQSDSRVWIHPRWCEDLSSKTGN